MKEQFKDVRFTQSSIDKIQICENIIEEYMAQGLRLTLRQLFYQLVTKNIILNKEREYKNLGRLISDARLAGLLDWSAIEDRVRQPHIPNEFSSLGELVQAAIFSYRLPRWKNQEAYVELSVEKDALAGVLAPIARNYHITLTVNRGYSSQSAMYETYKRFSDHSDKECILLYLGDHDSSGEDMVRDITDRLNNVFSVAVDVRKIALTMDQIEQYNPPPNPVKMDDPRAAAYVGIHGESSWEVDALPPNVLTEIIIDSIREILDQEKMDRVIEQEEIDKGKLLSVVGEV